MTHYVYTVTHKLTGKAYVGISVNPRRRWIQHRYAARAGSRRYFHNALRAHGRDAFMWCVALRCETQAEALACEVDLIATGGFAYNLSTGGERPSIDREAVERSAAKRRGLKFSDEVRARMSAGQKRRFAEQPHPRQGVPHTEETRAVLSAKTKAWMQTQAGREASAKAVAASVAWGQNPEGRASLKARGFAAAAHRWGSR